MHSTGILYLWVPFTNFNSPWSLISNRLVRSLRETRKVWINLDVDGGDTVGSHWQLIRCKKFRRGLSTKFDGARSPPPLISHPVDTQLVDESWSAPILANKSPWPAKFTCRISYGHYDKSVSRRHCDGGDRGSLIAWLKYAPQGWNECSDLKSEF